MEVWKIWFVGPELGDGMVNSSIRTFLHERTLKGQDVVELRTAMTYLPQQWRICAGQQKISTTSDLDQTRYTCDPSYNSLHPELL